MIEPRRLTIALDYDDTYTADPAMWDHVIGIMQARGHRVICVTCRRDTDDNRRIVQVPDGVPVYFTSLSSKTWFMAAQTMEKRVDIWIDDHPESLVNGR